MSLQIPTHFSVQYKGNVELLLQQRGSKLRHAVGEAGYVGKSAKAVDQVGAVTAQKRTSRHADTPLISTPADARWVFPSDYEWADLIDSQDKIRTIIDPQGPYTLNAVNALGRSMDDEIVAAAFGTAKTGENGTTSTTFPASAQDVGTDVGGATSGLNMAKIRRAFELLLAAEVDVDNDPLFMAIGSRQYMEMFGETPATSTDFIDGKPISTGKLPHLFGFSFIPIERLALASSSRRTCIAWAKSGLHLGIWDEIDTSIDKRADKSNATQIYAKGTFGATRTQEKKVVRVYCTES